MFPCLVYRHYSGLPWTNRALRWRHNGRDGVSSHQPHVCLLNCLFRRRSKKTSKLRVTGLCSPAIGEFPAQRASNAENVSIWWRHHGSIISGEWKQYQPHHTHKIVRVICPAKKSIISSIAALSHSFENVTSCISNTIYLAWLISHFAKYLLVKKMVVEINHSKIFLENYV